MERYKLGRNKQLTEEGINQLGIKHANRSIRPAVKFENYLEAELSLTNQHATMVTTYQQSLDDLGREIIGFVELVTQNELESEPEAAEYVSVLFERLSNFPNYRVPSIEGWEWCPCPDPLGLFVGFLFSLSNEIPRKYEDKIRGLEIILNGLQKHLSKTGNLDRMQVQYYPGVRNIVSMLDECYVHCWNEIWSRTFRGALPEVAGRWDKIHNNYKELELRQSDSLPQSKRDIYRLFWSIYDSGSVKSQDDAAEKTLEWIEKRESLEECSKRVGLKSISWESVSSLRKSCTNNPGARWMDR